MNKYERYIKDSSKKRGETRMAGGMLKYGRTRVRGKPTNETPATRRGLAASRWGIASFAILAALLLMGALVPSDAFAATYYLDKPSSMACGDSYSAASTMVGVVTTTSESCTAADGTRYRATTPANTTDAPIIMGWVDNGGFTAPQDVSVGTTGALTINALTGAINELKLELVELDSTGTVIGPATVTGTNPATICTSCTATTYTNVGTGMGTGSISAGNTFGFRLLMTSGGANTRPTIYFASSDGDSSNRISFVATPSPNADGLTLTNPNYPTVNVNQGAVMSMIRFQFSETDNVGTNPAITGIVVDDLQDGVGNNDPDNDVNDVRLYMSTDTTLDVPGDTLVGSGTLSGGTANLSFSSHTVNTANYYFVAYYVYLGADPTHQLQAQVTDVDSVTPGAATYIVDSGFPFTGAVRGITAVPKDIVVIDDLNVLTSGYVETGIKNSAVLTYSLSIPTPDVDGEATLDKVKIDAIGSDPATNVENVEVWMSTDSVLDFQTDTQIDTNGPYDFSGGTSIEIDLLDQTIDATPKYFFYVYDVSSGATYGGVSNAIQAEMVNEKYIELTSQDIVNAFTGFKTNSLPIRQYPFTSFSQCYECHTFPPLDTPASKIGFQNRNAYSGAVIGDHEYVSHVQSTDEDGCGMCHPKPNGDFNHQNGDLEVLADINGGGFYNKPTGQVTSVSHTGNPQPTGTCINTQCHGETSPQWGIGTIHCIDCHSENQKNPVTGPRRSVITDMETATSHHIYNTTAFADSSCEVCHLRTTHTAEGDPNVRLLNGDTGAAIVYDGTGASAAPACVSCHDEDGVSRLGQNAKQPFFESGDFNEPINIGWKVNVSAHDLAQNLTTDKCFGCHGNSAGSDADTLNPARSAHGSDQPKMLRYAYDQATPQTFCYTCHDGSGANADIQAQFALSFNHSTGNQKCTNCHEVHQAEGGTHTPGQLISNVTKMPGRDYEYEICFNYDQGSPQTGCHYGGYNKSDTSSETYAESWSVNPVYVANWSSIPDVYTQFSTSNLAFHPVFGQGRNQPSGGENSEWATNTGRKSDVTASGLDHNFVDGWGQISQVICSDCHGNSASGPVGPHGSSQPWILKGVDATVTVTTVGGTINPNAGYDTTTDNGIKFNFCINCHRSDVYGNGAGQSTLGALARFDHTGNSGCFTSAASGGDGGGFTGCMNCHGGAEVAGIHGTNAGPGDPGVGARGDDMGKRFMNGNAWTNHDLADTTGNIGCATGTSINGVAMAACSGQHAYDTGKDKYKQTATPKYYYTWTP